MARGFPGRAVLHYNLDMTIPLLSILLALFILTTLWLLNAFRRQRAALRVLHQFIANMALGQYARRTDPWAGGKHGGVRELATATNVLAEDLEGRAARAQQDREHLVSILALLDHTNEIAFATDSLDTIRLANAAAARMFERNAEGLIDRQFDAVIHHPDLRVLFRNAFSSKKPVSGQIALQMPGRTVHCQATAAAIYHDAHYRGTLVVLRDVTEIARTLQMKTDFATNASHELRTPLASIRAAVDTMKEAGVEDAATTQRCIDIITNHVLRMQLMVQDLLDLSRAEDARALIRSDRVDVQLVCDALAAASAMQLADKKLRLEMNLAPDARTLRGDERLLTLTLKNLLDNAIKFTSNGGITIRSYLANDPEAQDFVLEVQDTGIGIPVEDQERVFERFYTVNRSRGGADRGTGLGLSIVKHAVNAMQGTVSLESTPNVGTTMRCVFPMGNGER